MAFAVPSQAIQAKPADKPEISSPAEDAVATVADPSVVSEAFGHLIGKNLESLGFEFDMEKGRNTKRYLCISHCTSAPAQSKNRICDHHRR